MISCGRMPAELALLSMTSVSEVCFCLGCQSGLRALRCESGAGETDSSAFEPGSDSGNPEQGSVGASGDLAPLSHLALVLIGEGRARYQGQEMSGAQALKAAEIQPIRLGPKEGLALINGTQFMTALGVMNLLEAEHLCDLADAIGAMTVEALRGSVVAFEPEIHSVRPHPGQIRVAKGIFEESFFSGGGKSGIAQSHENCGKVQDPYSLRCMPQVHGASRDTLAFVRQVLEREINSVTDNPLVFPKERKILSGGNFHGQAVAIAMDTLAIAVAELASISEQRIEKLVNPAISDLPPFSDDSGRLEQRLHDCSGCCCQYCL